MPQTVIYNTETERILHWHTPYYTNTRGQRGIVEPPLIELDVVNTTSPSYDDFSEKAILSWVVDIANRRYVATWTILPKTEEDFAQEAEIEDNNISGAEIRRALSTLLVVDDDNIGSIGNVLPYYRVGVAYKIGDAFRWEDNPYRVISNHTSAAHWRPDQAVSLYVRIGEPGEIPVWVQPTGAHDAYNIGDRVRHVGKVWESTINANTTTPGTLPEHGYWIEV